MKNLHTSVRIALIGIVFVLICVFYTVVLVNVQITGQDYYTIIKEETDTRYVTIAAKRGEIYDRNGKALVINTTNYNINLEYGAMPRASADFNEVILTARTAIENAGAAEQLTEPTFAFTGSYPNYTRDAEFFASPTNQTKFNSLLRRLEKDEDISDDELLTFLRLR